MSQRTYPDHYSTYISIASLAFISACVTHEVIGHGGACIAAGHQIVMITSVYFQCNKGGVIADIGGPLANFVVGVMCYFIMRAKNADKNLHIFILLSMAFNLFWCAGCMIVSAVADKSDFAYLLTTIDDGKVLFGRMLLFLAGAFIYGTALRALSKAHHRSIPFLICYFSAGTVSCITAIFYTGEILTALREAALEGFGLTIGLLYLHFKYSFINLQKIDHAPVKPDFRWIIIFLMTFVVFIIFLGRGIGL